ncbi:hypothetical protein PCNPT3_04810 [Psychromonas sp. CNPT3]|nr:hypothetical protein [Psychromonas sp. CNPT3]AGH80904.1 hypothetical protein PCNPT3_04810 [Psychromonas sp. CNPT3]
MNKKENVFRLKENCMPARTYFSSSQSPKIAKQSLSRAALREDDNFLNK